MSNDETNIGSINISGVSNSTVTTGNITTHISTGGDVVAGDKIVIIQEGQDKTTEAKPLLLYEPKTVLIPAGPFLMGSDEGEPYEAPLHEVTLPDFRIGLYPVTNAQFAAFIHRTGRLIAPEAGWNGQYPPEDRLNHPALGINWYEALAYCAWLSEQTGRSYGLPNEAQWEKAARGVSGHQYPWGNNWQSGRCHHGHDEVAPVNAYPPQNEYGLYDLVGNVREWTRSLWGEHRQAPDAPYCYPWADDGRNELRARANLYRVYRGGAATDDLRQLRCSARNGYLPDKPGPRFKRHGFRVVQELNK